MLRRRGLVAGAVLALCACPAQAATVTWSSSSVQAGSRVGARANGFAPYQRGWLRLGTARRVPVRTDGMGGFQALVRVPRGARPGALPALAVVGRGRVSASLRVVSRAPGPGITLSASSTGARVWLGPTSARRFSSIFLAGDGFRRNARVDVRFDPWRLSTLRLEGRRSFTTSIDLPRGPTGESAIQVTSGATRFTIPVRILPPGPVSASAQDAPLLAAAGDVACKPGAGPLPTRCRQTATARLLERLAPSAVAGLGDLQYERGTLADFQYSFDASWGAFLPLMRPAPGNHEYYTPNADGYHEYFGALAGPDHTRGYYSYDLGAWHVVALNSNCELIPSGCAEGSYQETWLRADLATHPNRCVLAYWHHPLFASSAASPVTRALWQALYDHGADLVLAGHGHHYERFAPQTATGAADPRYGIRQFVVGTGGKSHGNVGPRPRNSQVRDNTSFGVLGLVLRPSGYDWRFHPIEGDGFTDAGTATCHDAPLGVPSLGGVLAPAAPRTG
jgi:calcineurin-like phosphoesterase family protein